MDYQLHLGDRWASPALATHKVGVCRRLVLPSHSRVNSRPWLVSVIQKWVGFPQRQPVEALTLDSRVILPRRHLSGRLYHIMAGLRSFGIDE